MLAQGRRNIMTWSTAASFVLGVGLVAGGARAVNIVPTFMDGAGQTWDATKRAVINQAISDWDARILNDQTIAVTFDFTNAGTNSYLGLWQGNYNVFTGTNIYAWTP